MELHNHYKFCIRKIHVLTSKRKYYMFSDSFSRWRKHRSGDIDNFNEVNISRKNKKSKHQNSVLLLQRKTEC